MKRYGLYIIIFLVCFTMSFFNFECTPQKPDHIKKADEITIVAFSYTSGDKDTFTVAGRLTLQDKKLFINGTLLCDSVDRFKRIE